MSTSFTSIRTLILLLTLVSTHSVVAQSTARKTALTRPAAATVRAQPIAVATTQPTKPPVGQPVAASTEASPAAVSAPATEPAGPRNKYLNVGVGLAAYYGGGIPLGASLEVDLKNNISVGGSFDYLRYRYGYTFIYAGARASYHLSEVFSVEDKKFDPYVGATLGFRHAGYDRSLGYDYGYYNSGLYLGVHLGSRYYFSEKIGGFAEVGYGVSALRVGLTAKF